MNLVRALTSAHARMCATLAWSHPVQFEVVCLLFGCKEERNSKDKTADEVAGEGHNILEHASELVLHVGRPPVLSISKT